MEGKIVMFIKLLYVLSLLYSLGWAEVKNFGLCKNEYCSEPIALGKTLSIYSSPEDDKLSFKPGQEVKIYARSAGLKRNLFGVEIDGKKGYAPEANIKETMALIKTEELVKALKKLNDYKSPIVNGKVPDVNSGMNPDFGHIVADPHPSTQTEHYVSQATDDELPGFENLVASSMIYLEHNQFGGDSHAIHSEEIEQSHVELPGVSSFMDNVYSPAVSSQSNPNPTLAVANTASQSNLKSEPKRFGAIESESSHSLHSSGVQVGDLQSRPSQSPDSNNIHATDPAENIRADPSTNSDIMSVHPVLLSDIHVEKLNTPDYSHTHIGIFSNVMSSEAVQFIGIKNTLTNALDDTVFSSSSILDSLPPLNVKPSKHLPTDSINQHHISDSVYMQSEQPQTDGFDPSLDRSSVSSADPVNIDTTFTSISTSAIEHEVNSEFSLPLSSNTVGSGDLNSIKSTVSVSHVTPSFLSSEQNNGAFFISQNEQKNQRSFSTHENEQKNVNSLHIHQSVLRDNTAFSNVDSEGPSSLEADDVEKLNEVIGKALDAVSKSFIISESEGYEVEEQSSLTSTPPFPTPTIDDMQETRDILKSQGLNESDLLADEESLESLEQQLNEVNYGENDGSQHYKGYEHTRFNYVNDTISHYNENKGSISSHNKLSSSDSSPSQLNLVPESGKKFDDESIKDSALNSLPEEFDHSENEVLYKEDLSHVKEMVPCINGNCEGKASGKVKDELHYSESKHSLLDEQTSEIQEVTSIPSVSSMQNKPTDSYQTSSYQSTVETVSDQINSGADGIDNSKSNFIPIISDDSGNDNSGYTTGNGNFVNTLELEEQNMITPGSYLGVDESTTTESHYSSRDLKSNGHFSEIDVSYHSVEEEIVIDSPFTFNISSALEILNNSIMAVRSFIETVIIWLPEPLQSYLIDLEKKGVSPRVTVLTTLCIMTAIFLFITIFYIKECSKEKKLMVKLSNAEQKLFLASTERDILKEEVGKCKNQLEILQNDLEEKEKSVLVMNNELEQANYVCESTNSELGSHIEDLKQLVERHLNSISKLEDELNASELEKQILQKKLQEEENDVSRITVHLQEFEEEIRTLRKEREELEESEANYKEKSVQLELDCNQLLQEAVVWNERVKELSEQLQSETAYREELQDSIQSKDTKIESLKNLTENLQVIQDLKDSSSSSEENTEMKMKELLDTSSVQLKLSKVEKEKDSLQQKLNEEKEKVLDLEVEVLEAKSETEKLKLNYNQALQDKTEAQTKLEVLSNYFKDKELQLQKELGVQEAVRQQKEEDASFATRQVHLIEEENTSYKYQVATLKQEIEDTERNYKNQVAAQEKKAHENWIAARAAERKLEEVKQESVLLRQRLTLLEREQENWLSSREEVVRPVPKQLGGPNGEVNALNSQDISRTKDVPSLPHHEMIPPPLPPMMLPLDRPLPPMMPPLLGEPRHLRPMLPPYLHPGDRHLPPPPPPPFRPQPWHMHPDNLHSFERRTPPRLHDSPPSGENSRDSRSSSPLHALPRFHDIPPPPLRPYDFPPPPITSRFPLVPPSRRGFMNQAHIPSRTDSRNSDVMTSTPRGSQFSSSSAAQDRKQQQPANSRV